MKVPIAAIAASDHLVIYRNGKGSTEPFPFEPFVLVDKTKITGNHIIENWTKVPENINKEYSKVRFKEIKDQIDFKNRNKERAQHTFSNGYLEQLFISKPDFMTKYPNTDDVKIMYWDIEVATKGDGLFPKSLTIPILCIGWSTWAYKDDGSFVKLKHKIIKGFDNTINFDRTILEEFLEDVHVENPDIIAGYNSDNFDWPYVIDRLELLHINPDKLSRTDKPPIVKDGKCFIPGRISFDIYNSQAGVIKDQTLFGIKSKSLKELARWYGISIADVEVKEHISNMLNLFNTDPDLLYAYLNDDILRTEFVGAIYLRNCITLAEMMHVPLNNIMNMYSSFVPKLFIARNMETEHFINTETNFSKYNEQNGSICKLGTKYEGALVGLYQDGFFENTYKIDFTSMYPSAIQTFNLGPDTTSLVSAQPYTGKYNCVVKEGFNWYRVPTEFEDGKFKYDLIVKVKNDKEGFLKKEISSLRKEREKIKKESKTCAAELKSIYNSQQVAIKVLLNSIYGMLGLKSSVYGEMISAAMVTGMCRWVTTQVINRFTHELIELDSVTGDTPVYVYNINTKELDIIPIQDLHNHDSKRKLYTGSYLVMTRNGWKKILYTKKHKVQKNIHRVKISDGYVDVTQDHSLFDLHKNEISPINIIENKSVIETLDTNPINLIKRTYGATISHPDFCWLIGFLIAEGSVYEGYTKLGHEKRQVSFNGNNLKLMKKVEKLANIHFRYLKLEGLSDKPHTFKLHNTLKSSAVYKVQGGYNKDICDFLKSTCYTLNRKDKKIPTFIFNGSLEMKNAFIDGLMTCDGYKTTTKDNRQIESLDSKFKSLAAGIRFLWNSLNYPSICNIRKDKLNITTYRKRVTYKNGTFKTINKNLVSQNNILNNNEQYVYDISTEDGTFVTALGNIVLHNTDGLILKTKCDPKEVNTWLDTIIKDNFNITDNYMQMELDSFGRSFFYAMKNYVVQEDDDFIIHGSSLKSSKFSFVADRARDLAIQNIFNNKPIEEVLHEAYDFKNLEPIHFIERLKLTKEQVEYDDQRDYRIYLAKQIQAKTGEIITSGTQMPYIITKNSLPQKEFKDYQRGGLNYTFTGFVTSINDVDFKYYEKVIDKMLAKFGIERIIQTDLFGTSERQKLSRKRPLNVIKSTDDN